jgi:hypothetical protein
VIDRAKRNYTEGKVRRDAGRSRADWLCSLPMAANGPGTKYKCQSTKQAKQNSRSRDEAVATIARRYVYKKQVAHRHRDKQHDEDRT